MGEVLIVEVLLLVVDPDSVEAEVEDVRLAESVSPHQGRHLPLSEAKLRGEVRHEAVVVEEAGGEVEERVRVRSRVTVLQMKLLPLDIKKKNKSNHIKGKVRSD